ncbi:MAG: AIPR family protein [Chloroflexota bacterium]|nr:AIPR family protein [Chloroflexota bacterium]
MTNTNKATLVAAIARRIPDPNFKDEFGLDRHLFVVSVKDVPAGIPLDPNARRPKTSKRVYQKVKASLFNQDCEPGTFHLKNKGITIVAQGVKALANDTYEITMLNGVHGILDGGHTYTLITEAQSNPDLPPNQFVNVEVRVGVPETWIPEIAGGLNTSVQVQDMSLDNLSHAFQWIKDEIKGASYYGKIAWSENDPGEYDARDIVSLMAMFNVDLHPNDGDDHPVYGYEKKSVALKSFEDKSASFKRMKSILKDILRLHDIIRRDYYYVWNEKVEGGKAGSLAFSEKKSKGLWDFPFTNQRSEYRMVNGALYPILAAFRWFVERDAFTGEMSWRDGIERVLEAWQDDALTLLKSTYEMSNQLGRNPQSIGKSRPHWSNLHNIVAKRDLQRQALAA